MPRASTYESGGYCGYDGPTWIFGRAWYLYLKLDKIVTYRARHMMVDNRRDGEGFWQSVARVGITDFSTPDISHLPVRSPISQDRGTDIGMLDDKLGRDR